jgi:predicted ATPase
MEGVLLAAGDAPDAAAQSLRASLEGMRESRYYIFYTMFLSELGEALRAASRVEEGLAAVDEALERAKRNEELWFVPETLRIKGELNLLKGAPEFAAITEDHFGQALEWARRQGALSWELRAATNLARLWHGRGRTTEALALLEPIYNRFTESFETVDLKTAKALVGQMRAPSEDFAKALSGREVASGAAAVPSRSLANFPEPVSELIGREVELSQVSELVTTHRLVTLIGEGGVGKTRLGIEVVRQLKTGVTDGVGVAELGPLSDPGLVPVTVATSLGLNFAAGAISAERVAKALGARQLMLVLDNCEHVIGAAASMAEALLHLNPAIRVLATSREPLRTEGEYLYRVPPLAVPAESAEDTEELLRHGAVQLFVTRARAADPRFSPDGRSAVVAAAICRRLDGIPLAIELAAARGAALGVEDLASRLDDRFHLLTGGHRTAPPRQQTLRATLDWSYKLLPETERMVLRRLAIFAGSFGVEAARAAAASPEIAPSDVVDCVGESGHQVACHGAYQ